MSDAAKALEALEFLLKTTENMPLSRSHHLRLMEAADIIRKKLTSPLSQATPFGPMKTLEG